LGVAGVAGAGPASPSFFSRVAPPSAPPASAVASGPASRGGSGASSPASTPPRLPLVLSTSPLHQHATPASSTAGGSTDASSLQDASSPQGPRRGTERTSVGERDDGASGRPSSTAPPHSSPPCFSPSTGRRRESHRGKLARLAQEKKVRPSSKPLLRAQLSLPSDSLLTLLQALRSLLSLSLVVCVCVCVWSD
jgi:hypothetical protein